MQGKTGLGLKRVEAIHYYVHDLARSRRFYCEMMGFDEIAVSSKSLEERGKQRSAIFRAADVTVICSEPVGEGGRAARFMAKHPAGIGTVVFEVHDIEHTFRVLEERHGTPITDIQHFEEDGTISTFSITTPFGDTTFRFVERHGTDRLFFGFDYHEKPIGLGNPMGFQHIDHITSNFQTLQPAMLWMEHVMGFESYWDIAFHTSDLAPEQKTGSGLRSKVMWDPESGAKFANNEPLRPFFKTSQINIFGEQNRGDGVQHLAIACSSIIPAVKKLREAGIQFMPTPGTYYDVLQERLNRLTVGKIDEDINVLRELGILVDGKEPGKYLLQIFLQEAAAQYEEPEAGPFFFEVIQRKGDQGFGAGNFRALFESIEMQQRMDGLVP